MSERDHRLDHALDLLAAGASRRSNGAVPILAVALFALSGAVLVTVVGQQPPQPVAASKPAAAAQVVSPVPVPVADFEVSAAPAPVEQ